METARLGRRLEATKGCCGLPGAGNLLFSCSWEGFVECFCSPCFALSGIRLEQHLLPELRTWGRQC